MKVERLKNTRSAIGRHLARLSADLRRADGLHGRRREAVLRGAARQFMQAGDGYRSRFPATTDQMIAGAVRSLLEIVSEENDPETAEQPENDLTICD